ncbi:PP2C family protein-serine/threonine phosphatase [Streptomyces brasiliensis]|uniref:Membrane protein n=1 Tax=Streptomyces brasiliensis TaxID=1954 RepID=A0A917KS53_9ACTN|nr:PP2C family protein-serine/threonine phosphatase [Streptomyces brasiliensis]GGJ26857.1 membrane protein [Streptomyces brasiliensis]
MRGRSSRIDREVRGWLRGAPPPRWVRVLPVILLAGITVATLVSPDALDIGFLLGAIPPLAVLSYGPLATALLGALVVVVLNVPATRLNHPGYTDLLTISFVALLSVLVSYVRSRRDEQLTLERTVAKAVQQAVVPPLPKRVGAVGCAGLYQAAEHGTLVGGDFFDVREGPYGVRAVMADVQGHGLQTVTTVVSLLGAFREAVLDQPGLEAVAGRMDRRLTVDSAKVRHAELFATALLLEFSADLRSVRIVSCGNPAPVLLHAGRARVIGVPAGVPLGLGMPGVDPPKEVTVALEPGDRLFLASDGVWEARDSSGTFYPLVERLTGFAGAEPEELTGLVWADLAQHSGEIHDDTTMLVLTPLCSSG